MRRITSHTVLLSGLLLAGCGAAAQDDSLRPRPLDSFLLNRKGLIGDLAKNLLADKGTNGSVPQRTDSRFVIYTGKTIRNIYIQPLDFGVAIGDTTKALNNKLTHFINDVHYDTREKVVRNHLFFREGSSLVPLMLAINERHLRDLSFIQEAQFIIRPVPGDLSSVDIIVLTKDAFSLSGGAKLSHADRGELEMQQDNFLGYGDRIQGAYFFDAQRRDKSSWSAAFTRRNIKGSFIDISAGHRDFHPSFVTGKPEEAFTWVSLLRPLVHPYMRWTYAAEFSDHNNRNQYAPDSTYQAYMRYRYLQGDVWGGINIRVSDEANTGWYSWLISARMLHKQFEERPLSYAGKYYYRFVNFTALLGSVSLFRQDFYKANYIYGFGRNEDVPEGMETSLVSGLTWKDGLSRPYVGLDAQWYHFTRSRQYLRYTIRAGSYWYKRGPEDIALLGNIDYFSKLHLLGTKWKHRNFFNASFGRQWNYRVNEPLLVESRYGLPGFKNNDRAGDLRGTVRGESVFFSPWMLLYFRMAPFVFGSGTVFRYADLGTIRTPVYTAVGGGLRIQNESLVFGTIEIKGTYYPRKDFSGVQWRLDLSTNLRYRFNTLFIRKPEIITVN
jgi:hypothetical protein